MAEAGFTPVTHATCRLSHNVMPGLVRWYAVNPADDALQWFDKKGAQDRACLKEDEDETFV
jgi:hypothetical protein